MIDELRARKVPYSELHALDDERSAGAPVGDDEARLTVGDVAAFDFSRVDLVFFCGRATLSQRYAQAAAMYAWVIDGSAAFRAQAEVPLVVADVNPQALAAVGRAGSCAAGKRQRRAGHRARTAACASGLIRVEVATYQAVSGSGRGAMDELAGETVAMLSGKKAKGLRLAAKSPSTSYRWSTRSRRTACRVRSAVYGRKLAGC